MHISHLVIRNFRALERIECDLGRRVNVIVGPNGVGKTTILQAIRLAKALTGPRTQQEPTQVLYSLGAASPHFPQRLFINNLARDATQPIEIRCTFDLTDSEITTLRTFLPDVARSIVATRFGQTFANPGAVIQIMQSPQGHAATEAVNAELSDTLSRLIRDKSAVVGVTLIGATGHISLADPLAGTLIQYLDGRLPPHISTFSFFPADRALPMGDVNLQLGGSDVVNQLESHNSQPQLKYQRLKQLIINSVLLKSAASETIQDEFQKIFSGLLKDRKIKSININEIGLLSVLTEETATGRPVELDSLSSGEKNIALTFLLIATSVARGGIALFDEPELHLNPAVSRDVLPFMVKQYSVERDIQFIMCTHSPEIVSNAFSNEDCNLLHVKATNDISRVGKAALDEYADALHKLGTSVTESLLYDATVFVEGETDVVFLKEAFPDIFRKLNVKERGGRIEVEKAIRELQATESGGHKVGKIYFILDRDAKPSSLQNSTNVKILQWPRRCVENYMIDVDVISALLKESSLTRNPKASEGEVHGLMRELAYAQLNLIAAKQIYSERGYRNASLTGIELKDGALTDLAAIFYKRMADARASLPSDSESDWVRSFKHDAEARKDELMKVWEAKWRELCDGKKLLHDLHRSSSMRIPESVLRIRIIQMMRDTKSDDWRLVKQILEDFLKPEL